MRRILVIKKLYLTAGLLFLFLNICRGDEQLKKTSFIPLWSPQAQFAGYYVAYEKGIYKKQGLDVTIIPGGPANPPGQLLKAGKADFGIMWLTAGIRESSRERSLVNIAQMTQRSALILVAKKSSGIRSPQDMNGKRISFWEGDLNIQPKAFIKKFNLAVKTIPQSYSVNLFLRGGVDVVSAMWYNEYHTILDAGIDEDELSTFFYDQYDLNFPEDGIYVQADKRSKDPALCGSFVKASLEGWDYAFAHEEETLDIILKYMRAAKVPANRVHQKWMLGKMKELMRRKDNSGSPGTLNEQDYERVSSEMLKLGEIRNKPEYDLFYQPVVNK